MHKIYSKISSNKLNDKFLFILSIITFFLTIYTLKKFYNQNINSSPKSNLTILIFIDLIFYIALILLIIRKILNLAFYKNKKSKLRSRIILMFSLVAAIPTILISAFSILFFNLGIQNWFDNKVSTSIETSLKIADSYIHENKYQLKETAKNISSDLIAIYSDIIHNPDLFNEVMDTQSEIRGFSEAIVFQRKTNTVIARSRMSFSLIFSSVPSNDALSRADKGDIVELENDPTKIRVLIKLGGNFYDTYMIIGKIIDPEIVNYVNKTNGAANQYLILKENINKMQISFAIIFVIVSIVLLALTIGVGAIFGNYIARPINRLVFATQLVQKGDLTVRVKSPNKNISEDDEINILTNAFNKMVKRIDIQQKDLVLAQRALAWSDVARRVAHEIKNPLTPIMLSAERLDKKYFHQVEDKESFKRYTSSIIRHTVDIQKIVSEFTNFAKMPSPNFEKIDVVSLIKDQLLSRTDINDKYCYNFTTNIHSLIFNCDKTQINQVVLNLCKNAEESLENKAGERIISVNINYNGEELEITFKDNGPGFSEDLIHKATEAYFTTRSRGSGLGLAIVKKIVQDHSGNIEIFNSDESGGVVRLIFEHVKINE